jgi:hypothetical protein
MDITEAREKGFDEIARHPWELARLDVVRRLIRGSVGLDKHSVVMDIGCGDVFVVESLAADYPDASFYAIDTAFSDELIKKLRERLKVPNVFLFRSLDEVILTGKQVSFVLLMDVIEHIEDDRGFLTGLLGRSCIGKDTRFLITVPAYQSLFCSHDVFLGHYRRYSNKLLRAHAEAAGLKIVDMGYFFFSLLPVRVLQVVKENVMRRKPARSTTGVATWKGGKSKSWLIKQILLADAGFSFLLKKIGIRLAGLSNYAICRRSV